MANISRTHPANKLLLGVAIPLFLAATTFVWLGAALDASWRFDDGYHLNFVQHLSPLQYFFDPSITRKQSSVHLTPWNALFYDINISLFGARVSYHYLHLLIVLAFTAVGAYALTRQLTGVLPSMAAALLFIAGIPTFRVANALMAGHYAYGLLFSAGALLAFLHYRNKGSMVWLVCSALLYLLACACKEVFAPIPLLVLALPGAPFRRQLLDIAPFAAVAVIYLLWRFTVLGELWGGYGHTPVPLLDRLSQFARLPLLLTASSHWSDIRAITLSSALLGALGIVLVHGRRAMLLLAAGLVIAGLPLFVLAGMSRLDTPGRYLFVPWFMISVLSGFLISKAPFGRVGQIAATGLLLSITAGSAIAHRPVAAAETQPSESLYSAIANATREQYILLPPETSYPLMFQLFAFAHAELTGIRYRPDMLIGSSWRLCQLLSKGESILAYDHNLGRFATAEPERLWEAAAALDARRRACLDPDKLNTGHLSIQLRFSDGFLAWRLEPQDGGTWHYLVDDLPICTPIRPTGRYPLAPRPITLRFVYSTPHGWRALSPTFNLEPGKRASIEWAGLADQRVQTRTPEQCARERVKAN